MTFNIKAFDAFRNAKLQGDDAIANIGKDNAVTQKGTYHGKLGAIFRVSSTKAANNAARTELLRSLGDAFGLEGIGRNAKGVTTFSKDFMDKLAKLLGPEFKREDFEIASDGTVKSGKPLTQRRISAIIKQATLVGKGEYDYDTYKTKLAYVKAQIAALKVNSTEDYIKTAAVKHFEKVAKLMEFAETELPNMIEENWEYDPKKPEGPDNPKYVLNKKLPNDHTQVPLDGISTVSSYIQDKYGELFHIQENILAGDKNIAHLEDLKDPQAQITEYLTRTIQTFVMTSIDLFIDAEKAGKDKEFMSMLSGTWPCIEGKTTGLTEYRLQNIPMDDAAPVATHDKDQPLNQCIGREIAAIMEVNPNAQEWKDVAAQVKTNLVGVIRPIDIPEKHVTKMTDGEELTTYQFKPVLGETGKPVVRAITEADIDALGEAVMDTILFG